MKTREAIKAFRLHIMPTYFIPLLPLLLAFVGSASFAYADDRPEVFVQLGHSGLILSVAYSPDGRYAVSGGSDRTVKLWDATRGLEVRTFAGHGGQVNSVTFSPDGRHILSGSGDGTMKLWDVLTGREVRTLRDHAGEVTSVAFSPDGRHALSGSGDVESRKGAVTIWDVGTGKAIRTLLGHGSQVTAVAFSRDGRYVLSGSWDGTLRYWEVSTGREIRTIVHHLESEFAEPLSVHSVAFTPDGRYALSAGSDYENNNIVKLWDLTTGREVRRFGGPSSYSYPTVYSVVASPDGKYVLFCGERVSCSLWELATGREVRTFPVDGPLNRSAAFSPDGKRLISGSYRLTVWEVTTGQVVWSFAGRPRSANALAISPDGRHALLGLGDGPLPLWDLAKGRLVRTFHGHTGYIQAVVFSPDGRTALSCTGAYMGEEADNTVKLWDVATGRELKSFEGHSDGVRSVAFSPDGKYALSGSADKTIRLWDLATGLEVRRFQAAEPVNTVAFSPDGKTALSGSGDKSLTVWDVATGRQVRTLRGLEQVPIEVAFSPDGRYAVAGSEGLVMMWEIKSGKLVSAVKGQAAEPGDWFRTFSRDGRYALSVGGEEGVWKLWDLSSGTLARTFAGHSNYVRAVAMTPDGTRAVSVSWDDTARVWEVSTGKERARLIGFDDGEWIAITSNGYYISSDNGDKHLTVRIGNTVYTMDNYREAFYRPDLVKVALSGGSLKDFRSLADVKQPPSVLIVDTPRDVTKEETTVTVKLMDLGGGIGDVRLYLNGSAVVLDSVRGVKVVPQEDKAVVKTYTIRLISGINTIRAIAFNGDNTMQSTDALHQITASFKPRAKPSLHAVVVGINEYKNPKLMLKYAVGDADLFAETLKKSSAGLFGRIAVKTLTKPEDTTAERILAELASAKSLSPDDLFVFFVASHGTLDDGEYFLITSNVGSTSTEKLKRDAISQTTLKELIANIPATKKLILIDTCNAGALGDALQVTMLTRGMSEDTAMKVLSRAVGSTILSASTSLQEAIEGYNNHGLFTYVVTEGLKGKADADKDGFIKTTELANYVDDEVPVLAEKVFKKAQYPTVSPSGMAFPVGKAK